MITSSFWLFWFETKLPPVWLKHSYETSFLLNLGRVLDDTASTVAGTCLDRWAIVVKELLLAHLLIGFINHNSWWSLSVVWRWTFHYEYFLIEINFKNYTWFKNFIFRHQSLVCLQRFVIRRDTTRIFPDGFRPSGIIARAPTLYKVNRSLEQSTDSSKSEIDATSERGSSSAEELSFQLDSSFYVGSNSHNNNY